MRFKVVFDEPKQDDASRVAVHSQLVLGRFSSRRRFGQLKVFLELGPNREVELASELMHEDSPDQLHDGRNWETWRFGHLVWAADEVLPTNVEARFEYGNEVVRAPLTLKAFSPLELEVFKRNKLKTLDRVRPLLRCVAQTPLNGVCGFPLQGPLEDLRCSNCEVRVALQQGTLNFGLSEFLNGRRYLTRNDLPGSFFGDPRTIEEVSKLETGLILDVGSGWRYHYEPNVVHYDSALLPSTDVLADGTDLPFADESFDGVFSFSVLEHVKDPMKLVSEIKRVTKRGGIIQISAPHLIQYHGHPDHYFNPTFRGLRHLLGADVEIVIDETPQWGHPIWGLVEILREWGSCLPDSVSKDFEGTTIGELMGSPAELFTRNYVTELDLSLARGIATNNFIVARKKSS